MLILMIICAFLILCLLYGMYASARSVARGADRILSRVTLTEAAVEAPAADVYVRPPILHANCQSRIEELRAVFALYQSGALTHQEFEQSKRYLLAKMTAHA